MRGRVIRGGRRRTTPATCPAVAPLRQTPGLRIPAPRPRARAGLRHHRSGDSRSDGGLKSGTFNACSSRSSRRETVAMPMLFRRRRRSAFPPGRGEEYARIIPVKFCGHLFSSFMENGYPFSTLLSFSQDDTGIATRGDNQAIRSACSPHLNVRTARERSFPKDTPDMKEIALPSTWRRRARLDSRRGAQDLRLSIVTQRTGAGGHAQRPGGGFSPDWNPAWSRRHRSMAGVGALAVLLSGSDAGAYFPQGAAGRADADPRAFLPSPQPGLIRCSP